ncbi:enoyl-CoA hydratase/isomerase family protein [Spongiibacter sp. KMU-158]|uniref:Enoyl-CoA hydratase/isomerase family protein n=1 Tax=Spongiibacter pelagi TaxID=2760804 RepID=A0A927C2T9_9GAMM|nr:enoyl-CoA hydratase-related protein [Spongiibacter pelagi]MBD2858596.1 enoyl-CoA hydratase/isomerase family protein [Spongiibacter pelagi]
MSQFDTLNYSKSDGLVTITLNRPNAANSINLKMAEELCEAAILCDSDPEVRAVLLTSNGKMFSAGGDLPSFIEAGAGAGALLKAVTTALHSANSRFARMRAPLVVAVNGTAAGAGLSLALSGDMVFAAESAKFTLAYTGVALSPDGGASHLLPRLIGMRRTQEMLYTNRVVSAAEALEWGMLTRVVADADLLEEASKLAKQLAQGPTRSFGQSKALLLESFENGFEKQLELESRSISALIDAVDGQEGIRAFAEKRKPVFQGK